MITIYWHCLGMTEADEKFLNKALDELAQHLIKEPIKLPVNIKQLGEGLAKEVNAILHKLTNPLYTFSNCVREIFELFVRLSVFDKTCPAQLFVYCPPSPDSPIANAAQKQNSSAKWGATAGVGGFIPHEYKSRIDSEDLSFMYENFLCAVYENDKKVAIWHEALHLLGADDCYIVEDNRIRKKSCCNLDGCIMEYNPPENTCEKWPFLCDRNVKKLKELAKKAEQARKSKTDS